MVILNNDASEFRGINIYPDPEEILGSSSFYPVTKNIIDGAFSSVEEYLDIQFRLLREDFIANLRKALKSYKSNEYTRDIEVYKDIKIYKVEIFKNKRREQCLKIKVSSQPDDDKKFMKGSLLLFTRNDFETLSLAKVVQRRAESEEVIIEMITSNGNECHGSFTMAECSKYFDPYFQVLTALKAMNTDYFPMEQFIVKADNSSIHMPKYILDNFSPTITSRINQMSKHLNKAQFTAYAAALTQEFIVIQGPPGTGKSFLGIQIATFLLQNRHTWYKNTPLLVISFKNDALDHFLEALLPITNQIARVGSQSKNDKLLPYVVTKSRGGPTSKHHPQDYFTRMRNSLVVGMTTSLASRWKEDLMKLKCPIVIVEEAAEILEAHVVAALTPFCQHLILIGDHKQLQPMSADHNIRKNYNLGISLFERMVRNGVQHYQLDIQHRMKPEISSLVKDRIYPFLQDHESVKNRPLIRGVCKNLYFIDHQHPEETIYTTKKNSFEARFVILLATYFILNGYTSSDVAILATYAGQVQELEQLSAKEKFLKNVKISTLDGFQGQEAEIVLLSLVRSDAIGFLEQENRVGVALSRARNGFFIIGNMNLLARRSKVWSGVKKCLQWQNAIGDKLSLRCQKHNVITEIKVLEDFWNVKNGGCHIRCEQLLSCGHCCSLLCHKECMKHKCEKGCLRSYAVEENEINENLWGTHYGLRNTNNYETDFNQTQEGSVQEQQTIFERIGTFIRNFIRSITDSFN